MRAVIDTNPLHVTQAGVSRYVRGLLAGLGEIPPAQCHWSPLAWEVDNFAYAQPQRALKTAYRELIWANFIAPSAIRDARAEVVHTTSTFGLNVPARVHHVATLYDLALLRHPERFRRWQLHSGRRGLRSLARVERVITISQFTADEAMALLGLPARQLQPILLGWSGVTESNHPVRLPEEIPAEFFLFVGSLEPGKNLALLREVWALAERAGRRLPPLVVAGARWVGVPGEGAPPQDWHYLGHVPDELLAALYRRAIALVFPSKYEGFGLPLLEAMGRGCPVLCSRVASLPEVGGDAAWWCELNAASYLAALRECATNGEARQRCVTAGRAQAARFSWSKCAQETVAVYRDVTG